MLEWCVHTELDGAVRGLGMTAEAEWGQGPRDTYWGPLKHCFQMSHPIEELEHSLLFLSVPLEMDI